MGQRHWPQACIRTAASAILAVAILFTHSTVPAAAHATMPSIDPNCSGDETPADRTFTIGRTGYIVKDFPSPDASYANPSKTECARYWKVGVYNARGRTVKILAWWGQEKFIGDQPNPLYVPSVAAKCEHTIVTYYVWGLTYGSGYVPLGGGDLYGVWNGNSCAWKGDLPYTPQRETTPDFIQVRNSPYDYFVVRAEAYDHFSCPTFHCNWPVKIRLYVNPLGSTLGQGAGEAGMSDQSIVGDETPSLEAVPTDDLPTDSLLDALDEGMELPLDPTQ